MEATVNFATRYKKTEINTFITLLVLVALLINTEMMVGYIQEHSLRVIETNAASPSNYTQYALNCLL